jgi:hypothetical protein
MHRCKTCSVISGGAAFFEKKGTHERDDMEMLLRK